MAKFIAIDLCEPTLPTASATGAASSAHGIIVSTLEGHYRTAIGKGTKMDLLVAPKIEISGEAGIFQHIPGVGTNLYALTLFKIVMVVEVEAGIVFDNAAPVPHHLAEVLADRFEHVEFEQPPGSRPESGGRQQFGKFLIADGQNPVGHQTRIEEAHRLGEREKIHPVQGTGQALAP